MSAAAGKQDCPLLTGVHLWPVTVPGSPAGQGASMHTAWGLEHCGTSNSYSETTPDNIYSNLIV